MGLLLLPFALMVVLFALAPLAWVLVLSLRAEDGWSFARYAEVLGDRFFLDAFAMSLYLSWWSSVAGLIAALFAAASLRRVPGRVQDAVVAFANMAGNLTGVPLAFAFMILLGTNGTLTLLLREAGLAAGFDLYTREGLVLIYTYFQIPLAVLMLYPAFDGLDDDWSSAAALLEGLLTNCAVIAGVRASAGITSRPSTVPLPRTSFIQDVMSDADELTPPAGDWASGWRCRVVTFHWPSIGTCEVARLPRAMKSAKRELVDVMPSGA